MCIYIYIHIYMYVHMHMAFTYSLLLFAWGAAQEGCCVLFCLFAFCRFTVLPKPNYSWME